MVRKTITFAIAAALLGGGASSCAQSSQPKERKGESAMQTTASLEAERAAEAAEKAANMSDAEIHPKLVNSNDEKQYQLPAQIPAMPWPVLQRRITTLIASVHLPEDTHPSRVEAILGVKLEQVSGTHWKAEGSLTEGWEYSIAVGEEMGELATGYNARILLMPPEIDGAPVSTGGSTLCTWSMADFSKLVVQNGYEKGMERRLAKEFWDFYDLTSDATYNRYLNAFVYRMRDGSERGAPCLSKIEISTGYKEGKE